MHSMSISRWRGVPGVPVWRKNELSAPAMVSGCIRATNSPPQRSCSIRPDIDNGFATCPTGQNGGFSYANLDSSGR